MQQLSLFRGVHDTQPHPVTLDELVTMMRTDQSVRDLTEKHRYARSTGDERNAGHYKKMMPSFGVAARFEGGRQQKHIVEFTGLSLVDIDHVAKEDMPTVLAKVRGDEHTLLAYTTISGEGVRILARLALNSNDNAEGGLIVAERLVNRDKSLVKSCEAAVKGDASVDEDKNGNCHPDGNSKQHNEIPLTCSETTINQAQPINHAEGTLTSVIYKTAFLQVNEYYQNLTGLATDHQCKNVTRISSIAYDEQLYYNPAATPFIIKEEKKAVGRPRRGKSEKLSVKSCATAVLRELERRGVAYAPGSHNKYISDACYLMNRYGVPLDDCTAWALDRFSDYQAAGNDVPAIVRSCYQQTTEHATLRPPREEQGRQATVAQIEAFLSEHVCLRRNALTGFVEVLYLNADADGGLIVAERQVNRDESLVKSCETAVKGDVDNNTKLYTLNSSQNENDDQNSKSSSLPFPTAGDLRFIAHSPYTLNTTQNDNDNENHTKHSILNTKQEPHSTPAPSFRQFTDDDRNSLWRALSKELNMRVIRQDISAVVKSDFSPRYHPFEEYVSKLSPWDGVTDHIYRLASSVTVRGDQDYFRQAFKKWLVAFIAAIFNPEEVNHEILVFIGRQGSYKSTWFHYLLPPELRQYFLPKLMSHSGINKDDLFKIAQSGLVCLEEIDNMKQRDLNQLKALTTMRTINERRSYGEFNEFHHHIASFCATGNNRFFLTDHTGNRRFLTFEVESIVPPQTFDYDYEGIYAQAYALWQQGFRYWFNEEENNEINQRNAEFESPNKELELILKYFRRPMPGEQCKFLTASDILERINGGVKEQLSAVRIGMVMHELGIERIRAGNLRGYRLIENTQNDIDIKQRSMAAFNSDSVAG